MQVSVASACQASWCWESGSGSSGQACNSACSWQSQGVGHTSVCECVIVWLYACVSLCALLCCWRSMRFLARTRLGLCVCVCYFQAHSRHGLCLRVRACVRACVRAWIMFLHAPSVGLMCVCVYVHIYYLFPACTRRKLCVYGFD